MAKGSNDAVAAFHKCKLADGYPVRVLDGVVLARKLLTKRGRAVYRKRKYTCEPVIGWIKAVLGFCQFSMRGLDKVNAEWKLVCTAINLRRMAVLC